MSTQPSAPLTATVARIAAAAMAAGLTSRTTVRAYRGALELEFVAPGGADAVFGMVEIGAKTGRVLRGFLRFGFDGERVAITDGRHAVRVLKALPRGLDHELAHLLTVVHDGDFTAWDRICRRSRPAATSAGLIAPTDGHGGYRLTPAGFRELTSYTTATYRTEY